MGLDKTDYPPSPTDLVYHFPKPIQMAGSANVIEFLLLSANWFGQSALDIFTNRSVDSISQKEFICQANISYDMMLSKS